MPSLPGDTRSPTPATGQADRTRRALLAAIAGASLAGTAAPLAARDASYPARAVRIVVPYSVGVGPDVVARCVADALAHRWGGQVLVENKPGASGIVAFGEVRRTPPDGHTLFLADTATMVMNALLHDALPYDPTRDLVPLTMLFRASFVLWVGGASPHRRAGDMLEAARRAPGRLSYGSLGHGHASHVAIETLARAADVRLLHVPFTDAGTLFAAVAGGEVDFTAFGVNSVAGLMAAGRLRPLAVASSRRLPSLPEVPTLPEAGGPPVEMHPWAALVTVAGTPPAVLERLRRDLAIALASEEVRVRTERAGFELTPSTPKAVLERVRLDHALYGPLVSEGRIARM